MHIDLHRGHRRNITSARQHVIRQRPRRHGDRKGAGSGSSWTGQPRPRATRHASSLGRGSHIRDRGPRRPHHLRRPGHHTGIGMIGPARLRRGGTCLHPNRLLGSGDIPRWRRHRLRLLTQHRQCHHHRQASRQPHRPPYPPAETPTPIRAYCTHHAAPLSVPDLTGPTGATQSQ